MNDILLTALIGAATTALGYFFGGKRKAEIEAKQGTALAHTTELDAIDKAVGIWRNLAQDLKKEVDELRVLIAALRIENDKLQDEVEELKRQIAKYNIQ